MGPSRRTSSISKTIDIGREGTAASADSSGTVHGLTTFHPTHGLVVAEPYPQFDGSKFHDPRYVREYRTRTLTSLRAGNHGFGVCFDIEAQHIKIEFEGLGRVSVSFQTSENLEVTASLATLGQGELVQCCTVVNTGTAIQRVSYRVGFGISINRASYGQLTEGGPIPLPKSKNELQLVYQGFGIVIANAELGAYLDGMFFDEGEAVHLARKIKGHTIFDGPIHASVLGQLELPPESRRSLETRFRLRATSKALPLSLGSSLRDIPKLALWSGKENQAQFIIRRNLEYILGSCTIPLPSASDAVCLITDHVALPLGWNRDNYWQARFLLDVERHIRQQKKPDTACLYSRLIKRALQGHLIWVFRFAERPLKYWHRSYLVTGRPKDGAVFQLDQQCYPVLLLCDFLDSFPEELAFVTEIASDRGVPEILDVIASKRDPTTGLFLTEETPGDDAVEYPFHFSSQVLLWYTFSKLSKLISQVGCRGEIDVAGLEQNAVALRAATVRKFLARAGPDLQPMFVYLTNGKGLSKSYHDANDIPTLFVKAWGFVKSSAEVEAWMNTMLFGFSTANEGGYYGKGRFAGLGSVHTPAPWPLGYFQMWRFAQMTRDDKAEDEAWEKICGSMQWDGTFSEAVDETGACISKAWFCWPGAMIGSGLLQDGIRDRYL